MILKLPWGVIQGNANISTNCWILDAGFSNFIDKTNYTSVGSYLVNRPGFSAISENNFKLNSGKSINLNIWLFMKRYNLITHKLNLKYGLGVKLNNYVFKSPLSYKENGLVSYSGGVQTNGNYVSNSLSVWILSTPIFFVSR